MSLAFEIFDAGSGVFTYTDNDAYRAVVADFDRLMEARETGQLGEKPYLAALDRLLTRAPDLIDLHVAIASHWHWQGKPKKALDAALAGLGVANRRIPEGFDGHIEWGHFENRPYLRAMHLALLSHMRLRRHKDAVTLIDQMLARNPGDNQGVRYLLGSEALRAAQFDRAQAVFEEQADSYPPYCYELALCSLQRDDWIAAATALRRGFAANPYIAEIIMGNPQPAPLAIWHGTNLDEPETAHEYMQSYGMLWHRQPDGIAFLRWLFNHSGVLAERAAIMVYREALSWEADIGQRSALLAKQDLLVAGIDDSLSTDIVAKRKDRRGNLVWPWMAM